MAARHEKYASELVEKHGLDHALKIMENSLNIASKGSSTLFYDEADYVSNEHGNFDLAKTQSKKVAGKQTKRIKTTVNFYNEVIKTIKRNSHVSQN
jgi:hypothetical protein